MVKLKDVRPKIKWYLRKPPVRWEVNGWIGDVILFCEIDVEKNGKRDILQCKVPISNADDGHLFEKLRINRDILAEEVCMEVNRLDDVSII